VATTNPGQSEIHHRASGVADELALLDRREASPGVYLALLDVGSGVGSENRHAGYRRGLGHRAITEPAGAGSVLAGGVTSFRRPGGGIRHCGAEAVVGTEVVA
jgi:hypothetical protein